MLAIPQMDKLVLISDLVKDGKLVIVNGGLQVTNNIASGVNNSIISFGEGATNTVINNNNSVSEDLLKDLFKHIDASTLNDDKKKELKEIIDAVEVEAAAETPKKSVISSLLDTTKRIIDTATKSPELIDAYTKWAHFIQNPPTF